MCFTYKVTRDGLDPNTVRFRLISTCHSEFSKWSRTVRCLILNKDDKVPAFTGRCCLCVCEPKTHVITARFCIDRLRLIATYRSKIRGAYYNQESSEYLQPEGFELSSNSVDAVSQLARLKESHDVSISDKRSCCSLDPIYS